MVSKEIYFKVLRRLYQSSGCISMNNFFLIFG